MSVRDYELKVIVTDALNGEVIATIPLKYFRKSITSNITELLLDDMEDSKHGFIIKYGY